MLPFEDRIRIALGAGMGCQLRPEEVREVAGYLVALRAIRKGASGRQAVQLATAALKERE